jgi:virulence-associated protein VagC
MHESFPRLRPCKIIAMKAKVTKEGVLIPREFLDGIPGEEVEIRKEPGKVVVLPAEDPILGLGENPIEDEITDASVNLDRYLYGSREPNS